MERHNLHYNVPQLRSAIVDAPEEIIIKGRGTGKTEGILAPRTVRVVESLPRSSNLLVAATFQQILTRTLPPLVNGWEKLGYKQGIHYLIGIKPPEKWRKRWKWQGPYRPPFKYEYVISWWNGAVHQMVSQDRIGSTNGMSVDSVAGDEAKLLNRDRLHSETLPANRGRSLVFDGNHLHHSLSFTTDMPVGTSGRWLLEKEKSMDVNRVQQIMKLQVYKMQFGTNPPAWIDQACSALRRGAKPGQELVYFQEANTLENIHALGIPFIRQMMRNLSAFEFNTSILNRRPMKLEDGFYPDLDEDKHGYFSYNYHKFENTGYDFKKLKELDGAGVDGDYDPLRPLHIALDYNRGITPMVVAQVYDRGHREIRCINGIHELYPKKLDDTLQSFIDYYKHHLKKMVYYWYDHTATAEYSHAGAQRDDVLKKLRANGWTVIERYIGVSHGHERRYTMYGHLLKEDDQYPYILRINRDRCEHLLLSMFQAQAIRTKRGFGKDKKPELDPKFPQEEATHYSEAIDMLLCGILETNLTITEDRASVGIEFL